MSDHALTPRRGFLGRLAAAGAALAAGGVALPLAGQAARARTTDDSPHDAWLSKMNGKHKQFFDSPIPNGAFPLLHVRNYLNGYRDAYQLPPAEVNAAYSLYFLTVPLAFNDAMWAKYPFGERAQIVDHVTNAPAKRNVFSRSSVANGVLGVKGLIPIPEDVSIEALQARNTAFLLCNNAFNFWVAGFAGAGMGTAAAIRSELEANMLPGVTIVPAMVVAINRAQDRGFTYMYLA